MSTVANAQDHVDGYAAALFAIARVDGGDTNLVEEIHAAAHALSGHPELVETLRDPGVPAHIKHGIVNDLLGTKASEVTVSAMNFIVSCGQARNLSAIGARLAEMAAEEEGEVVAEVRTPMDLDAEQIERLQSALARATNRRVQVRTVIDPSVVGGIIAKVGDTVLDGSIKGRFADLREQWS